MKQIWEFLKGVYAKFQAWWNEMVSDEELAQLAQEYKGADIPKHLVYANPIRRVWESVKVRINKSAGKGSFLALVTCLAVTAFILLTGGHNVLAVMGVALATIVSLVIAISRFEWLNRLISKYYKIIDLVLFAFMFIAAESIFGLQIAAIVGLFATMGLIIHRVWMDEKVQNKAMELSKKAAEQAQQFKEAIDANFTVIEPSIA